MCTQFKVCAMGALVPAHPSSHDDDEGTILLFCFARRLRRSASVAASQSGTLLRNQPSVCLRLRSIGRSILFSLQPCLSGSGTRTSCRRSLAAQSSCRCSRRCLCISSGTAAPSSLRRRTRYCARVLQTMSAPWAALTCAHTPTHPRTHPHPHARTAAHARHSECHVDALSKTLYLGNMHHSPCG